MKLPPLGVIVGVATVGAAATLRVKAVVLPDRAVELTVIGKLPAGVDVVVLIVNIGEQLAVQEAGEKLPVAPVGNPETANENCWLTPEFTVAVIEVETLEPAMTEMFPPFVSVKKLMPVTWANHALASELATLFLTAIAFISVLVVTVRGLEYFFDASVGELPSNV